MSSKKLITLVITLQMMITIGVFILSPVFRTEVEAAYLNPSGTPIGVGYEDSEEVSAEEDAEKDSIVKQAIEAEIAKQVEEARLLKLAEEERLAKEAAEAAWLASLGPKMSVPPEAGSFKSYMSYRAITSKGSPQYKLQYSGNCWTDGNGMRRCGDDYMIAVGTYYASYVGQRVLVTMVNGTQFTATIGDFKAKAHTNSTNQYAVRDKSVIEFIVDGKTVHRKIKQMGDCSWLPAMDIHGKIAYIQTIDGVG